MVGVRIRVLNSGFRVGLRFQGLKLELKELEDLNMRV